MGSNESEQGARFWGVIRNFRKVPKPFDNPGIKNIPNCPFMPAEMPDAKKVPGTWN